MVLLRDSVACPSSFHLSELAMLCVAVSYQSSRPSPKNFFPLAHCGACVHTSNAGKLCALNLFLRSDIEFSGVVEVEDNVISFRPCGKKRHLVHSIIGLRNQALTMCVMSNQSGI